MRVCTYNVLSSHLTSSAFFQHCPKRFTSDTARFANVLKKIDEEISQGAVICLQEVSQLWAGRLHRHFISKGYYFIHHGYGSASNGCMGVGVAFPLNTFELVTSITRPIFACKASPPHMRRRPQLGKISDDPSELRFVVALSVLTVSFVVRNFPQLGENMIASIALGVVFIIVGITFLRNRKQAEMEGTGRDWIFDPKREEKRKAREEIQKRKARWEHVRECPNNLVGVRLKNKEDGGECIVFTYHVPSTKDELENVLQCVLLAQFMEAKSEGLPYVVAGELGFEPDSMAYKMLTKNEPLPAEVLKAMLPEYEGDKWEPKLRWPLTSVYAEMSFGEPDFTLAFNSLSRAELSHFKTVDYILYHPGSEESDKSTSKSKSKGKGKGKGKEEGQGTYRLKAEKVQRKPGREDFSSPFPTDVEPSDHLKLECSFTFIPELY